MPSEFIAREAQAGALDTWYTLAGDGAGGTKTSYMVSAGKSRIAKVIMSVSNGASATKAITLVRLSGNGVLGGAQVICGPVGNNTGTAVTALGCPAFVLETEIGVIPGNEVTIEAKLTGTGDSGTPEIAIGLELV